MREYSTNESNYIEERRRKEQERQQKEQERKQKELNEELLNVAVQTMMISSLM